MSFRTVLVKNKAKFLLLESKKSKLIEYEYKNCIDEDLYEYVEK